MKEHVFSLNDFNMPKVYDEKDANYILIIRLLLLDPGKYQSHPTMGIGLRTRYRFDGNKDDKYDLKPETIDTGIFGINIKEQMSKFLPQISYRNIELTLDNSNRLGIIIESDSGAYVIGYDSETQVAEAAASYVLDNL